MFRLIPLAAAAGVLAAPAAAAAEAWRTSASPATGAQCAGEADGDDVSLLQVQTQSAEQRQRRLDFNEEGEAEYLAKLERRRGGLRSAPSWPLWPQGQAPAQPTGVGPEAFVTASSNNSCSPGEHKGKVYWNVTEPRITYFPASTSSKDFKNTTVLIIPGGAFNFLAWDKEGVDIAQWLNSIGYNAFVLKYRVPTNMTDTMPAMDAQRALSMIRSNATAFGLNASRVGLMGFSAGGSIAGMVSTAPYRLYYNLDSTDNFACTPDFTMYIYGSYDPNYLAMSSTVHPPAYVAGAINDQCMPSSTMLDWSDVLANKGTEVETHMYGDGRHGYGRCSMYTESGKWEPVCEWTNTAKTFLDQTIVGEQPPLRKVLAKGV